MNLIRSHILIILFIVLIEIFTKTQVEGSIGCSRQETCSSCLHLDNSCSWCGDPKYAPGKSRCLPQTKMDKIICNKDFIYISPQYDPPKYVKNEELSDFTENMSNTIQIQPQKVKVKLKKYETKTINFKYRSARNYPLDIYFLTDLTFSMQNYVETLASIEKSLTIELKKISKNYRIGFGSFIDKPLMPMAYMHKLENPCIHSECEPLYTFTHQLSLTNNISKFTNILDKIKHSGNVDNPEGGSEALMQVLFCEKEIGWRDEARKIIIYASNSGIHFAGDGKLSGTIKKNDKKCHLDSMGRYTGWSEFDYPSLGEIYHSLVDKKTSVIFIIVNDTYYLNTYAAIQKLIPEYIYHGLLKDETKDQENILQLIKGGYTKFSKHVEFFDNSSNEFSLNYWTTCDGSHPLKLKNFCENIEFDKEYKFSINISLLDYPENKENYKKTIRVSESSLSSVYLDIDVEIVEPCQPWNDTLLQKNSPLCNSQGTFNNGFCECNDGYGGMKCECNLKNYKNTKELENLCRNPDDMNYFCSNRGDCVCGKCECIYGFSGKYCECPMCPLHNKQECGGLYDCKCGVCQCNEGYTGDLCQCSTNNETCRAVSSDEYCSNKGICKCGACECDQNFYGDYCEKEHGTDNNALCSILKSCVECKIMEKLYNIKCSDSTCSKKEDQRENIMEFFNDLSDQENICIIFTKDKEGNQCKHLFSYHVTDSNYIQIRILMNKCTPVNKAFVGTVILIITFLLGLIGVGLYKIFNMYRDRIEFERFEKERTNLTEYNINNELYKSPLTNYNNPIGPDNSKDNNYFTEL